MRLLRSNLSRKEVTSRIEDLVGVLYSEIPTGVGSKGNIKLDRREMEKGPFRGFAGG